MRHRLPLLLIATALALAGCGYYPPDPIRYVTSPAEVGSCHRLGAVGVSRTDDQGSSVIDAIRGATVQYGRGPGAELVGSDFGVRVSYMRDAALALGATDLLLSRRIYHDWSYVEGIAYRCPR